MTAAAASPAETVLEVRDLHVTFRTPSGPAPVVRGLSYSVGAGETLAVVGESGSGKSVGVLALLGLLPRQVATVRGSALFDGRDLLTLEEEDLRQVRGAGIGMVFQDPMTSLNPVLTVGRQLEEALTAHGPLPGDQVEKRSTELLGEVGLPDPRGALRRYPHELSGGMRQRVMIAIALAGEPALLVADEATTALDVTVQAQILELVSSLQASHGTAVLWITHDLGVVAGTADRVLVMYAGRCLEEGGVDEVFESPAHPYTRGLLGSLPRLDEHRLDEPAASASAGARRDLVTIPGLPPDPTDVPEGCVFWPRCTLRLDPRCEREDPPLRPAPGQANPGHRAATWCDVRAEEAQ
jgi:peptide/nickel transport system ATP-binding protein